MGAIVDDVRHVLGLVQTVQDQSALFGHNEQTVVFGAFSADENGVLGDSGPMDQAGGCNLVHVKVREFSDNVKQPVFCADVHHNWEIARGVCIVLDFGVYFELLEPLNN